MAVTGGHLFRTVQVGLVHACAVRASDDRAFCWGNDLYGQLGIGNNTGISIKPLAVTGSLTFRHVVTRTFHTCGVTTDNRAFCWGLNRYGAVGDSSTSWLRLKRSRVTGPGIPSGGRGARYTCAVTIGNRAFCWGAGTLGQLGAGGNA